MDSIIVGAGLMAVIGIYQLIYAVGWISAHLGIAEDNYTLQLAVFHSVFNIIGIVVMLPLTSRLVLFLERLIVTEEIEVEQPRYLTNAAMGLAEVAVEAIRKESIRLYDLGVGVI